MFRILDSILFELQTVYVHSLQTFLLLRVVISYLDQLFIQERRLLDSDVV